MSGAIPTPSKRDPSGNLCRTALTLSIIPFANCVRSVKEGTVGTDDLTAPTMNTIDYLGQLETVFVHG